jgi:hypothetical protein
MNLKTAVEPRRRGEHQVKHGKTKQFDFSFLVNCGAVERPYFVRRLALFETSTAESRMKNYSPVCHPRAGAAILLLCGWSLANGLWANGAGTQAAAWTLLPGSARQAGLAGAGGALLDDLDALGVNPAGLGGLGGDEIAFAQQFWVQGLSAEHLTYGRDFGNFALAIGGDYLDFGQINQYNLDSAGLPVANGVYSPTGMDFLAGMGMRLNDRFNLGISVKTFYQNLSPADQAWALAANLGAVYGEGDQGLKVGLAVQNLGTSLDGAGLPLVLDLSAAFTQDLAPGHQLSLVADGGLNPRESGDSSAGGGAEYVYHEILSLRLGYRAASYGNLAGLSGWTSGIGIKAAPFELGYALTTLGDLGTAQEISLKNFF